MLKEIRGLLVILNKTSFIKLKFIIKNFPINISNRSNILILITNNVYSNTVHKIAKIICRMFLFTFYILDVAVFDYSFNFKQSFFTPFVPNRF